MREKQKLYFTQMGSLNLESVSLSKAVLGQSHFAFLKGDRLRLFGLRAGEALEKWQRRVQTNREPGV